MRRPLPKSVEACRIEGPANSGNGLFIYDWKHRRFVIQSSDGMAWDHVSVSLKTRTPTWEEMCHIKSLFFADEEVVMQLHPAKSAYVNYHPFCLHLWRPQSAEDMSELAKEWGNEWNHSWLPSSPIPLPEPSQVGPLLKRRDSR